MGDVAVVTVQNQISGVTKTEFISLIPEFERDMAAHFGLPEGDVLVTKVEEVAMRRLQLESSESATLAVDYAVFVESPADVAPISAAAQESTAAIQNSIEQAALVVLKKEVVVVAQVEDVQQDVLSEDEFLELIGGA